MNPSTGTFTTMDTYQGSIFDPVSLHKYLYANANPVTYVDPSGYTATPQDLEEGMAGSAEIDKVSAENSSYAIKDFKKLLNKVKTAPKGIKFGLLGGTINLVDQLTAGVNDPVELAKAFAIGFLSGFGFSFLTGKLALTLSGLGVIGGYAGAVRSFCEGHFCQGLYRIGVSSFFCYHFYKGLSLYAEKAVPQTKIGGRLGNQSTRTLNKQVADTLRNNGYKITGGGTYLPEEYLPGPNGARKGSNYVDITAQKGGVTYRINTVDTYANGTPTTREINAANSINMKTPGEPNIILIPKGASETELINILRAKGLIP